MVNQGFAGLNIAKFKFIISFHCLVGVFCVIVLCERCYSVLCNRSVHSKFQSNPCLVVTGSLKGTVKCLIVWSKGT